MKKWLENDKIRKMFRKDNLLILILAGILLFVVALPVNREMEEGEKKLWEQEKPGEDLWGNTLLSERNALQESIGGQTDMEKMGQLDLTYKDELEKQLTEVLSGMAGVGRVQVMITLKSSAELVVEKEKPISKSSTTESDAQGGNRSISTGEYGEKVIYYTSGNESVPYVVMTYVPRIEGVLVVAEGAGNGTVNKTITDAVCALFDVEAHKIKVVKMEVQSK